MQNNFYLWFLEVIIHLSFLLLFSKQSHGICLIKISKMEKKTRHTKTLNHLEMWNNVQNRISGCAWKVSVGSIYLGKCLFAFFFPELACNLFQTLSVWQFLADIAELCVCVLPFLGSWLCLGLAQAVFF